MASISVKNLTVTFPLKRGGEAVALKGVNARLGDGAFCVLVGPSGCGKTTLLRTVAGLQEYDGEILYDGRDADELSFTARNLSYVAQNYGLYRHLNVFDNIAFPLRVLRAEREEVVSRVTSLAESLDLTVCLNRKVRQLSGGQQQRVALARALVKNPSLCLLDEPLSNVDPQQREKARALMKRTLKQHGCTVLYVTHDWTEAMALADEVFVMDAGRIVAHGTPRETEESDAPAVRALRGR